MSNRDTKTKTGKRIDTSQKPVANFGQGERAFLVQKGSVDPSCVLTFPDLLQAKLNSKDSQFGSQQDPVPLVVNSPKSALRSIVLLSFLSILILYDQLW